VEFKTRIDGIDVTLTLPEGARPRRRPGEVCLFRCRCGLDEIRVTRDEIRGTRGHLPSRR